ncbi:phosphatidic acid phosphatase [Pseudomonas sp. J237]|nr:MULTISPECIES: phosphatase PAP2 family protein [Pseudomonas]OEO24883.1 phosphatidic acid phosphatase [Pseudomonas sp. J237]
MPTSSSRTFYLFNVWLPLLCAVAIFVIFDMTNIDVAISNWFYDPATHSFVLQHSVLFEKATHKWPRIIPNWTGEFAIIGSLLSFVWPLLSKGQHPKMLGTLQRFKLAGPLRWFAEHRRDLLFIVVSFAITTGFIHYFKSHTSIYCPVETTLYGGLQAKMEWYENFTLLNKAGDGRCWPGGHASGGFTMLALYFVARRYRWQHAYKLLGAIMLLGFIFGTTRVFQGWHYMSHTFWSGVVVWFSMLLTSLAFYGREALQQPLLGADEVPVASREASSEALPANS